MRACSSKNKSVFVATPIVPWYSVCVSWFLLHLICLFSAGFFFFFFCRSASLSDSDSDMPKQAFLLHRFANCLRNISFRFFFFFTSTCSPFVWGNTLKADFRLKCAPSLLPRSLLCYLPPIGLTLAHCSLASCQSWFLSPAPFIFLPFFLPFPPLLFSPLSPSLVESSRRFFRDLLPFHHISCFIRTVSFFLSFFPSRRFASLSICPFL